MLVSLTKTEKRSLPPPSMVSVVPWMQSRQTGSLWPCLCHSQNNEDRRRQRLRSSPLPATAGRALSKGFRPLLCGAPPVCSYSGQRLSCCPRGLPCRPWPSAHFTLAAVSFPFFNQALTGPFLTHMLFPRPPRWPAHPC